MPVIIQTDAGRKEAPHHPKDLLTDIAAAAGVVLNTRCAGNGVCGGCTVQLGPGRYEIDGREVRVRGDTLRTALACRTAVLSDTATVTFPRTSVLEREAVIDDAFSLIPFEARTELYRFEARLPLTQREHPPAQLELLFEAIRRELKESPEPLPLVLRRRLPLLLAETSDRLAVTLMRIDGRWRVMDLGAPGQEAEVLGLAVDIGTTTVAALLVDLNSGAMPAKASMYNQQIRRADDVASRISCCRNEGDVLELQRLVVEDTLNPLLAEVCAAAGTHQDRIFRVMVSGNTVMTHLFLGLSPVGIGQLPFQPAERRYDPVEARLLGLNTAPQAVVEMVPSAAGYLGGDITSDIYLTGLHQPREASLMIDVGTNGEMVFRDGDRLAACATAAGPAFEGYGLSHGCRAATGAIERIAFDGSLDMAFRVIGGTPPVGLCGSAVIDFIACGLRSGLLNRMGRYNEDPLKASGRYLRAPLPRGQCTACVVAFEQDSGIDGPLYVTEYDIAQVLKAKAAIHAGLITMLETLGMRVGDLRHVYLAGGFARHISLANAVTIGLFPEIPLERYEIVGNGSLAGAYLGLMDARARDAYSAIIAQPRVIELNRIASFESHFIDALALPHLDPSAFPRVEESLGRPGGTPSAERA